MCNTHCPLNVHIINLLENFVLKPFNNSSNTPLHHGSLTFMSVQLHVQLS